MTGVVGAALEVVGTSPEWAEAGWGPTDPTGGLGTTVVGMANWSLPSRDFLGVSRISVGERAFRLAVLWGSGSGSVSDSSSMFSSDISGLLSSSSCRTWNLFRVVIGASSWETIPRRVPRVLVVQGGFGSVTLVAMLSNNWSALAEFILVLVRRSCLRAMALAWWRSVRSSWFIVLCVWAVFRTKCSVTVCLMAFLNWSAARVIWRLRDSSGMGGRTEVAIRSMALSTVVGSRSQLF